MTNKVPQIHGLSGDLGWNEADDNRIGGLHSVLLVVATGAYFGSVWLLSGLAPLSFMASRSRPGRARDFVPADTASTRETDWRSNLA